MKWSICINSHRGCAGGSRSVTLLYNVYTIYDDKQLCAEKDSYLHTLSALSHLGAWGLLLSFHSDGNFRVMLSVSLVVAWGRKGVVLRKRYHKLKQELSVLNIVLQSQHFPLLGSHSEFFIQYSEFFTATAINYSLWAISLLFIKFCHFLFCCL